MFRRTVLVVTLLNAVLLATPCAPASAQVSAAADSMANVLVRVRHDSTAGTPVVSATVRSERVAARTGANGEALLRLAPGVHTIEASRADLRPTAVRVELRAGHDTTLTITLMREAATLEGVVVSATRSERRVEDTPLRVEVIDEEEISEKVAMTPGDISMMLNETSGLRVQQTNPSLGGANVRIQGLGGRYSLILADGLPLYGGQTGGLGLLQIPPVDLGRVEVIKGSVSALYGSSALGGVINLLSRRPGDEQAHTVLVNQTSRDGTDGVAFLSGPFSERWGYTLLAGAHRQARKDLDSDGWTDMPGYERLVVRPRLYFGNDGGNTAFLTGGVTIEDRQGGTLPGASVPGGGSFAETLRTRRADIGGLTRWRLGGGLPAGTVLTMRGSAMEQRHDHVLGTVEEDDRHHTWFGEAAITVPHVISGMPVSWVAGAAFQLEEYDNKDVSDVSYSYSVPSAFTQVDIDPLAWLSLSTSVRLDAHSDFGTAVNPRFSVLLRRPSPEGPFAEWTTRLSAGTGFSAPTPFTDETEATGLTPVIVPTGGLSSLEAERARSASLDVGGPIEASFGTMELNFTAFGSRVANALQVRHVGGFTDAFPIRLRLENTPSPTRTWGGELLVRLTRELGSADTNEELEGQDEPHEREDDHHDEPPALRITGTYTFLRSTECDPAFPAPPSGTACVRREAPLTPRHSAGMVASIEQHGSFRVGLELYYTGVQELDDNPYRTRSRPYLIAGILGERVFETRAGDARVFVNFENITNVRQTRHDPLVRPTRGPGGRWTTDAWSDLHGFTVNAGVRWEF
jgi:outer membrane receptor for ferrienterochelin and colicins